MEVSRDVSVREVFEAKNLARVFEYLQKKGSCLEIDRDLILFLHCMLLTAINDDIAGRFRTHGEFVRVGTHIASAPDQIESLIQETLSVFRKANTHILEKITTFHLDFETIHPFCDGNGRIGRVLINVQLMQAGYPPIIIRDKEKADYYKSFNVYQESQNIKSMSRVIYLAILESLHKRITYMKGQKIVRLTEYARKNNLSKHSLINKAGRQTIPAFREKGVWKIGS